MYGMFESTLFSGDISTWNTAQVQDMGFMFYIATAFNQDLSSWDVSKVTDFSYMFAGWSGNQTSFNGDVSTWTTVSAVDMTGMFSYSVRTVPSFCITFSGMTSLSSESLFCSLGLWQDFNRPLATSGMRRKTTTLVEWNGRLLQTSGMQWKTTTVVMMSEMFYGAIFNQDISNWDVSSSTDMSIMFASNAVFNQDISNWNVSNVYTFTAMFASATSFNQDLSNWDVSSGQNFESMFQSTSINVDFCPWSANMNSFAITTNMFAFTPCPNTTDPSGPPFSPLCYTCSASYSCFTGATSLRTAAGSDYSDSMAEPYLTYGPIETWCFDVSMTDFSYAFAFTSITAEDLGHWVSICFHWNCQQRFSLPLRFSGVIVGCFCKSISLLWSLPIHPLISYAFYFILCRMQ
jgi:surface protein